MPKVSVILTSYNQAEFIEGAIRSVLSQTYSDFELIIYDDCSTDCSWDVISRFDDPRIRIFRSPANERGLINKALLIARGEFIAIHHSDDLWEPDKLYKQIDYLEQNPNVGACFSWVQMIDENGSSIENSWFNLKNGTRGELLRQLFLGENRFCHPSAVVRKSVFDKIGKYNRVLLQLPDAEMWVRILAFFDVGIIERPLTLHRCYKDGRNTSGRRKDVFIRLENERFFFLNSFKALSSELLCEMFTSVVAFNEAGAPKEFLLYWAAFFEGRSSGVRCWGLQNLYSLLSSDDFILNYSDRLGFGIKDLVRISGTADIFSVVSSLEMDIKLKALSDERDALVSQLNHVFTSRTWRLRGFLIRLIARFRT